MSKPTAILPPGAGQRASLPESSCAQPEFTFDQPGVTSVRNGQNLVCLFNDGVQVTLENFYDLFGDTGTMLTCVVEGSEVAGDALLAVPYDPDLLPEAVDGGMMDE